MNLQDFVVLKTIHDDCQVLSLAWNAHLLAVGGSDKKVRVYDSSKDWGSQTRRSCAGHTAFLQENWDLVSLEFVAKSVLDANYLMWKFEVAFWHFGWQGW